MVQQCEVGLCVFVYKYLAVVVVEVGWPGLPWLGVCTAVIILFTVTALQVALNAVVDVVVVVVLQFVD